jgi:hypothetical protein
MLLEEGREPVKFIRKNEYSRIVKKILDLARDMAL